MKNSPLKKQQEEPKLKVIKNKLKTNKTVNKILINTLSPNFTYLNSKHLVTSPINKVEF